MAKWELLSLIISALLFVLIIIALLHMPRLFFFFFFTVLILTAFFLHNLSLLSGGIVENRNQKDISKGNLITKTELPSSLIDELLKRLETI